MLTEIFIFFFRNDKKRLIVTIKSFQKKSSGFRILQSEQKMRPTSVSFLCCFAISGKRRETI